MMTKIVQFNSESFKKKKKKDAGEFQTFLEAHRDSPC